MGPFCEGCGEDAPIAGTDYEYRNLCAACWAKYPGHAVARRIDKEKKEVARIAQYTETWTCQHGHTHLVNKNGWPRRAVMSIDHIRVEGLTIQRETLECGHIHQSIGSYPSKNRRCTQCPHRYEDELKKRGIVLDCQHGAQP